MAKIQHGVQRDIFFEGGPKKAKIFGGVKFQHFGPPLRPKKVLLTAEKLGRPNIDENFGWGKTRTSERGWPKKGQNSIWGKPDIFKRTKKPKFNMGQNRTSLKLPIANLGPKPLLPTIFVLLLCRQPWLHTTARELLMCTFEGSGASNTTKIPREDTQERQKEQKWVRERSPNQQPQHHLFDRFWRIVGCFNGLCST